MMTYFGIIHLFYWFNKNKKLVITYHNIIPDELFDQSCHLGMSHSQSVFDVQMRLVHHRFFKKNNYNIPLITFDDGYKNQIEIAARILNRYQIQGIFFVSFQSITTGKTLLIDKVMMWISYVPEGHYIILGMKLEIKDKNRTLIASVLYDHLLENFEFWQVIENELDHTFPFESLHINAELKRLRFSPFTTEDLKYLAKDGHLVATHSWSHYPLATLTIDAQREDFSKCISFTEKYCNSLLYSYPFGTSLEVSPLTAKLCVEYGFSAAYMNMSTPPSWSDVDVNYVLPRLNLPNETNQYLLDAKLSGFEFFCRKIRDFIYYEKKRLCTMANPLVQK